MKFKNLARNKKRSLKEATEVNPQIKNILISVISLLQHKANDKNLEPVISIHKIIEIVRGITKQDITYSQLADFATDPQLSKLIKSINKNQLVLNTGKEDPEETEVTEPDEFSPDEFESPDEEAEENDSDEEFNPDDFSPSEEEDGESMQQPNGEENSEGKSVPVTVPKNNIISNMAKRAASR